MKFEVKRGSITVMQTEHESCIPDREQRDILRKTGHKLYMDGKVYKEKSIRKIINSSVQTAEQQEEQMDGQMSLIEGGR